VKKDNLSTDTLSASQTQKITFADTYHGKVLPLEAARQLVMVNEAINLQNLEQIIPYQRARDIILRNPEHIVVMECPCRSARPDPCLPLDVCLIIGEPFASFVIEHHPRRARWITQKQAVDIITAENERGHVHHAFFKDAMFNRFYAICNCCSCCCGAMLAHRGGTPMLASSGYVTYVDECVCEGCGDCMQFCQFGALSMNGDTAHVDPNLCMGCGVCNDKCNHGALSLYRDEMKGEPLEICEFMERPLPKPATIN
jgi:Pyruvate/2-oxoacid:ferredoxin oxidoreductase delta subunit